MLVVDECQWADRRLLRVLRATYDHALATRFLLVLVGQTIGRVLREKEPGLASRVSRSITASPIEKRKLVATLGEYHPIFANTTAETILSLEKWASGNWRRWAQILEAALSIGLSAEGGIGSGNAADIRRLIGDLDGAGAG